MRNWTKKHKWGLTFEYKPGHRSVYAAFDFNGTDVWTEFGCVGEYASAAKFLREVADKLDQLHAESENDGR